MAESGEMMGPSEGTPAADTFPKKILEYMEGFLVSKVTCTLTSRGPLQGRRQTCLILEIVLQIVCLNWSRVGKNGFIPCAVHVDGHSYMLFEVDRCGLPCLYTKTRRLKS